MVKGITRAFIIELADGCKQAFPHGCPVYVKVTKQRNGIECNIVGFEDHDSKKIVMVSVLNYGFLEIPYEDIVSINRRETNG